MRVGGAPDDEQVGSGDRWRVRTLNRGHRDLEGSGQAGADVVSHHMGVPEHRLVDHQRPHLGLLPQRLTLTG
ncbi:hypothetical protein [Rhabdothermincola sediminis]|uniref:hypothetical protein n=1 Tax=Rhabdothermincola sediminis TaxID=2751370 RepID=UPI001AA03476|nr:hypothetical protein [Rhabdothermincola sediminis]